MKEFLFYLGPNEARQYVNRLLARGITMVPNRPYPSDKQMPMITGTMPEGPLWQHFTNGSIFMFGSFSVQGPVGSLLPSGTHRYVAHRDGGPMIQLNLPGWWPDKACGPELAPGMLFMQSAFWDANDPGRQIGPTDESRKYYRDLIKELKRELIRVKNAWSEKEDAWLGKEAVDLILASKAVTHPLEVGENVKKTLGKPDATDQA
jgi:hypothetical protein